MTIEVIPTRAALGAEISGIDLAQPLDDETFAMRASRRMARFWPEPRGSPERIGRR